MVYQDSAQLSFPKEKTVACHADHSQIARLRRGEGTAYPDVRSAIKQALLRVAEEQAKVGLSRLQLQPGSTAVVEERSWHNRDYIKGSGPDRTPVPAGKPCLDDARSQGSSSPEPQGKTANVLLDKDVVSALSPPASDGHENGFVVQNKQAISDPTTTPPTAQIMSRGDVELPEGDTEAPEPSMQRATDASSARSSVPSSPIEKKRPYKAMGSVKDPALRSKLCSASKEGDVEKVRSLLAQGCSIHEFSEDSVDLERDAFLLAALNGRLDVLKVLFEYGCDGSKRTLRNRNTALILISHDPEMKPKPVVESLVVLLLEHGVPLEARNSGGYTALSMSAYNGKISIVECLLEDGADIHSVGNNGYTALHLAAQEGHHEVVALLISKGACLETRTIKFSFTALHLSCFAGNGSWESTRLLLEAGADKEAISDFLSRRVLHIASQEGNLEIVNELLAFGVVIDAADGRDWRALHYAKSWGHWRIVEALLAEGANPLLSSNNGTRPSKVGWSPNASISPEDKLMCLNLLEDAEKAWKKKVRREKNEQGGGRFSRFIAKLTD